MNKIASSVTVMINGKVIRVGNSGIDGDGVSCWFGEVVGLDVTVVIGEGVGDCEGVKTGKGVKVVAEGVTVGVGISEGDKVGVDEKLGDGDSEGELIIPYPEG
jgi:hypothetical protein